MAERTHLPPTPSLRRPDPSARASDESTQIEVASQWRLMWWKFRKHRLAMIGLGVVLVFYLVAAFCEVVAPALPTTHNQLYVNAPPQALHWIAPGRFGPFVYGYTFSRDPVSLRKTWVIDETQIIPIGLWVKGEAYRLWGVFPADVHLLGPVHAGDPFYLNGTDKIGRDVFSRMIYSSRISLSIGLVGVTLNLALGILLGGLSGLLGGWVDNVIQRLIEILLSIPTIPIWLALAAVLPVEWPPLWVYFMITLILSLISWTWMARVVRSRFLALRQEDFILAAVLDGVGRWRLILRHMVPSFLSYIIAALTLAVPNMILAETALSFLGVGLRAPVVSWGVMLHDAQSISVLANQPWLLYPGLAVFVIILAFNFLGDGLRDAADPYR